LLKSPLNFDEIDGAGSDAGRNHKLLQNVTKWPVSQSINVNHLIVQNLVELPRDLFLQIVRSNVSVKTRRCISATVGVCEPDAGGVATKLQLIRHNCLSQVRPFDERGELNGDAGHPDPGGARRRPRHYQ
jgi:hypothetical protein